MTIDNKLSTNDILGLAMRFRSLDPNGLVTYTLPTAPAVVGGADVLRLQQPGGTQIVNQFLGKGQPPPSTSAAPPPPAPSSVRVQVLNGSGTSAQASRAATELNHPVLGPNCQFIQYAFGHLREVCVLDFQAARRPFRLAKYITFCLAHEVLSWIAREPYPVQTLAQILMDSSVLSLRLS